MDRENNTSNNKHELVQEDGFKTFYKSLPEKLSTTIRLFDRSDFWTVHDSDALFLANEVLRTHTAIRHFGSNTKGTEYVVVNRTNFETVIRDLLLIKQYRIEVYKVENSKTQEWSLAYKASPGNLTQFEDLLYGTNEVTASSGLLAIKSSKVGDHCVVGVSYCDVASRQMLMCQLVDDGHFGSLESVIVQIRPSECLVESGGTFLNILNRNRVAITEKKRADFDSKDIVQDMNRLLNFTKSSQAKSFSILPEASMDVAVGGMAALIKYLELLADESYFGQFVLGTFSTNQFVRLDGSVSRALNLLPSPQDGAGSFKSLFSVLNRCRTTPGQRLLSSWIHQPLLDINKIEDRLDIVEVLVGDSELRRCLHDDLLRRMPDLLSTNRKLQSKRAGLAECHRVYRVVVMLPRLLQVLESSCEEGTRRGQKFKEMFCEPLKELISDFSKFKEMIETTIDLSRTDENEFLVRADFDEKLQSLSEEMENLEEKCKRELSKAAKDLSLEAGKTIKLESNPQLGYFFRITRKEEKCLRGNERSYKTIDANKAGVRFRSTPLEKFNSQYVAIREDFVEQQKGVVAEIVSIACGYVEPIHQLKDIISEIDVFVSLATASVDSPIQYVRPQLLKSGKNGTKEIRLEEMRHPCLERQDGTSFIPNDLLMKSSEKMFNIITGPNMGGKSTYVRSAGMVVLMAQMGCFVPCRAASLTPVDALLARVGANDNQMKGVSTFMAEMLEMSSILKIATEDSFVIMDELGRGTSTYDGLGLAWSIARHIATEIKSFCLFATHFHELTSMADVVPNVGNLHVTAVVSKDSLTLLYKVLPGICDQSFGIHVAELVHFPRHVIENAMQLTEQMEKSTNVLIGKSGSASDGGSMDEIPRQVTLKDMKNFLEEAKKLSMESSSNEDLWNKLQLLKSSKDWV